MTTFSHAAKFTAVYVQGTYGFSFRKLLLDDPDIKTVRMIPYTEDPVIDGISAEKEAVKLVGHLAGLGFDLEENQTLADLVKSTKELVADGSKSFSELTKAVDTVFKFADEVDQS